MNRIAPAASSTSTVTGPSEVFRMKSTSKMEFRTMIPASAMKPIIDVAENGAVVPVQIVSRAANTTKIGLMVERNPNTLSAVFEIGAGMLPEIATRVRLQETSNVVAFVVADGKVLTATRLVSVTLGGCAVSS